MRLRLSCHYIPGVRAREPYRYSWLPSNQYVGDERLVPPYGRVAHHELFGERVERDLDEVLGHILPDDLLAANDRVERSEALLAVDDEQVGSLLLAVDADRPAAAVIGVLPEQQAADGIAPIHGVEQVPDLGVGPDERPLDVGEADGPCLDLAAESGFALHQSNRADNQSELLQTCRQEIDEGCARNHHILDCREVDIRLFLHGVP